MAAGQGVGPPPCLRWTCAGLTPRLTPVFPIVRRGTPFPGILQRAIPSADVAEILKTLFPQLLVLMQISSIIPMTSVDCERGFSAMNRIKTKTRNKLSNFVLDHLMRISLSKYSLAGFMEMHGISTVRRFFSMKTRKFDGLTKVEFQKAQAKGDVPISKIAEYL